MTEPTPEDVERAEKAYTALRDDPLAIARALAAARDEGWNAAVDHMADHQFAGPMFERIAKAIRALKRPSQDTPA